MARIFFGLAWLVVGIQHYIYADFVRTLVPPYMPWRLAWVYVTGTAMILAGIALLINRQVKLVGLLLGTMVLLFLMMVHPPILTAKTAGPLNWTRFFQDLAIMGAAFALSGDRRLVLPARYVYALPLLFLGAQHFVHEDFVTGKVPDWFPVRIFWDYLVGMALIIAGLTMAAFPGWVRMAGRGLGWMLLFLLVLLYIPQLIVHAHNGQSWTAAMLDLMIASGALILGSQAQAPSFQSVQLLE